MNSLPKRLLSRAAPGLIGMAQRYLDGRDGAEVERFGVKLGRVIWAVDKRRRLRAISNLELAFPNKPSEWHRKIAEKSFEHIGSATADFVAGISRTKDELESTTEVVGREYLDAALSRGKGVLLITGHFGNWERVSAWMSLTGYKLNVIIRDADSEDINQIVNRLREGPGTSVIPRGDAARPILEKLKKNEIVGILPDQNTDDIFIPFFGHDAGTVLGPGVIQSRTGATVLPVYGASLGSGRYRIVFCPHLEPLEGEVKGEGMMRAINAWLEGVIRLYPEQWLWMHDRWRSARQRGLV